MNPNITPLFSVSSFDKNQFTTLLEVVKKFGPYPLNDCVIAANHELRMDTEQWTKDLAGTFRNVYVVLIDKQGVTDYPLAPNRHFRKAMEWVATQQDKISNVWWIEPDCVPISKNWLYEAQVEFMQSGKRFWGTVVPTLGWSLRNDGTKVPAYRGEHMVGIGVYPSNFAQTSTLMNSVDQPRFDLGMRPGPPIIPFDIHFSHEIVPFCHRTEQIQHNWGTQNYRVENGQILCDPTPEKPELTERARPVRPGALFVHGCKDNTLHHLVLNDSLPESSAAAKAAPKSAVNSPAHIQDQQNVNTVTPVGQQKTMGFLAHRIHKILKDTGKSQKVPAFAKQLGVTEAQVEAAIHDPASMLIIGRGGWVVVNNPQGSPQPEPAEELATA